MTAPSCWSLWSETSHGRFRWHKHVNSWISTTWRDELINDFTRLMNEPTAETIVCLDHQVFLIDRLMTVWSRKPCTPSGIKGILNVECHLNQQVVSNWQSCHSSWCVCVCVWCVSDVSCVWCRVCVMCGCVCRMKVWHCLCVFRYFCLQMFSSWRDLQHAAGGDAQPQHQCGGGGGAGAQPAGSAHSCRYTLIPDAYSCRYTLIPDTHTHCWYTHTPAGGACTTHTIQSPGAVFQKLPILRLKMGGV